MANLTLSTQFRTRGRNYLAHKAVNAGTFYGGSLVGLGSGYAQRWADTAGFQFRGVALKAATGDTGASPVVEVQVDESGPIFDQITVTGVTAVTDVGAKVYCSTDNIDDLTLTATTNAKAIGRIVRWYSSTTCDVQLFTPEEYANQSLVNDITALTDNSGGGAADGTIGIITPVSALTDSSGGSGTTTLADSFTQGAAFTDNTTGAASTTLAAGAGKSTYSVYLRAAAITGNVLIYTYTPGFKFKILRISASCVDAVTTGAKAATLTTAINGVNTTGGIVILSGTYALGAEQASSAAVSGANTGTSAHAITVTASSVTAFAEGGFMLHIELQNMDTADALASIATERNLARTDISTLTDSIASLAARHAESRTAETAARDAVKELATKVNEILTDLNAMQ